MMIVYCFEIMFYSDPQPKETHWFILVNCYWPLHLEIITNFEIQI